MNQPRFFESEDLPLFSGAAPRAEVDPYRPAEVVLQSSFAVCRTCLDTGIVGKHRCLCGAASCTATPADADCEPGPLFGP